MSQLSTTVSDSTSPDAADKERPPTVPWRLPMVRNAAIGWYYVALLVLLAFLCVVTWPWGVILLWPIVAVTIMVVGYFFVGPAIYRKRNGRLPLVTRILLAPVIVGQYVSWLHYQRQGDAWNVVAPNVWIGRRLTDAEAAEAIGRGVASVVDLSDAFSEAAPFLHQAVYRHIPLLDLTAPTPAQLDEAVAFIDKQSAFGIVYVHCKIGYSRSAAIVGGWLLASGRAKSVDEAVAQLRGVRPCIVIRREVHAALVEFAKRTIEVF
jgi:Dual specificity phosphatase, catalytic domain